MRKRSWGPLAAFPYQESVFSRTMNAKSHNSQNSFLNFVKYEATRTLPILEAEGVFPGSDPKAICTPELWSPLYQFSFHVGLGLGQGL